MWTTTSPGQPPSLSLSDPPPLSLSVSLGLWGVRHSEGVDSILLCGRIHTLENDEAFVIVDTASVRSPEKPRGKGGITTVYDSFPLTLIDESPLYIFFLSSIHTVGERCLLEWSERRDEYCEGSLRRLSPKGSERPWRVERAQRWSDSRRESVAKRESFSGWKHGQHAASYRFHAMGETEE